MSTDCRIFGAWTYSTRLDSLDSIPQIYQCRASRVLLPPIHSIQGETSTGPRHRLLMAASLKVSGGILVALT